MEAIPQEIGLAQQFQGQPFAIVGVNGDQVFEHAHAVATEHGMTWRSFHNKRDEAEPITSIWNVNGWPTYYLIDHDGIIVRRWEGTPPPSVIDPIVSELLSELD